MSTVVRSYQDEWVKGASRSAGYRDCAARYEAIRAELSGLRAPFSVLDLGAHSGYFSFRLAEDFGARCVAVDDYRALPRLAAENGDPRVSVVDRRLGVREIDRLGPFDVILALSVLHHVTHWRWLLAVLRRRARSRLIVETPNPAERLKRAAARSELARIDEGCRTLGRVRGGR